ncbi:hypothetical protein FH972_017376 [Carpinus fangiana]|uniref:Uncharacterized protein n=1 Tax=Carpinus fangiana TaxID=176857 RepID=A0A5N6RJ07_9ROSI|nr:hypothetical protein FH972_017376 [Carpinus fangiana]
MGFFGPSVGLAPSTTLLPEDISSSISIAIFMKDMMEKEEGVVLASIYQGILGDRGLENRSRGLVDGEAELTTHKLVIWAGSGKEDGRCHMSGSSTCKRNRKRLLWHVETPMTACSTDLASTTMGLRLEWAAMVDSSPYRTGLRRRPWPPQCAGAWRF